MWAKALYNSSQAQIEAGGHKGWANGQATDLQEEGCVVELVMLAPGAASIAKDLAETTEHHGESEVGGASLGEPSNQVDHQHYDKDGSEGRIGLEVEDIAVQARLAYAAVAIGDIGASGSVGLFGADSGDQVHGLGVESIFGCIRKAAGQVGHDTRAVIQSVHGELLDTMVSTDSKVAIF